jgi:hypothetical protein
MPHSWAIASNPVVAGLPCPGPSDAVSTIGSNQRRSCNASALADWLASGPSERIATDAGRPNGIEHRLHVGTEVDRRGVRAIRGDEVVHRKPLGNARERLEQGIEGVASQATIERGGEPPSHLPTFRTRLSDECGNVPKAASNVVALAIEGVIQVEHDATDHHFGVRVNSSL